MSDTVKLLFSGDFAPLISPAVISVDHFTGIRDALSDIDAHITNLECPLTLHQSSIEKTGPALKAHPDSIGLLRQARIFIACLANNHIFDYGEQGLQDTIEICHKNQIDTIGLVNRPDGSTAWLVKEIKGKQIGFLNYCEHEFSVREDGLFGANGYDHRKAFYDIHLLRPKVDFLIVIYHGGNEYYPLPSPEMKKDFHYLADLGADIVIGHHTHMISGYEMYKGKPLVYSLGNFFFPYPDEQEEWHKGLLCKLELKKTISLKFYPVITKYENNYKLNLLNLPYSATVSKKLMALSSIITDDIRLRNSWNEYLATRRKSSSHYLLYSGRIEKLLLKFGLLDKRRYKRRSLALKNIMRCRSLKDVFVNSI